MHLLHVQPTASLLANGVKQPDTTAASVVSSAISQHSAATGIEAGAADIAQITDDSFEHTMCCLWDSCGVPLPTVSCQQRTDGLQGKQAAAIASSAGPTDMQALHLPANSTSPNHQSEPAAPTSGLCAGHNHTPDLYTASLVKHLLQDHLHLAPDILMQLSPSIEQSLSLNSGHAGPLLGAAGHRLQEYAMDSRHSTPHAQAFSVPPSPAFSAGTGYASDMSGLNGGLAFDNAEIVGAQPSLPNSCPATSNLQDRSLDQFAAFRAAAEEPHLAPAMLASASTNADSGDPEMHACQWTGCSMAFDSTSALMEHVSTSHIGSGKSHYPCGWAGCSRAASGRTFNQRQKVIRHVRTHVGDRPFVCTECGRAFSEQTTLAQHVRTHTLEKPFACTEPGCGKSFAIQSALTIHMRTHSGERPFKCPVQGCGQSFAESSNLSKHVKAHKAAEARAAHKSGKKRKQESIDVDQWEDQQLQTVQKTVKI